VAKSAPRLHQADIVPVFEVGRDGEVTSYAMQFIRGQGLDEVIDDLVRLRDWSGPESRITAVVEDRSLPPRAPRLARASRAQHSPRGSRFARCCRPFSRIGSTLTAFESRVETSTSHGVHRRRAVYRWRLQVSVMGDAEAESPAAVR
jgi:hypothetical protein